MKSLAQVLEAWRSGHITAGEAVEMTYAADVEHLKSLGEEHGLEIDHSGATSRRFQRGRQSSGQRTHSRP